MRTIAITLLALTATAAADRAPVISIGGVIAARSYANQQSDPEAVGGGRLTLAFEDAPIAIPAGPFAHSERLVPELVAGFLSNDTRAEGFVGAGVRAEIQLARNASGPIPFRSRMSIYTAARAKIIGKHQDPGGELVIGEYILLGRGSTRFGWEGGLGLRRVDDGASARSPQLEALLDIYIGWALGR